MAAIQNTLLEKKKGKKRNKRIKCEGKGAKGRSVQNAGGWPIKDKNPQRQQTDNIP